MTTQDGQRPEPGAAQRPEAGPAQRPEPDAQGPEPIPAERLRDALDLAGLAFDDADLEAIGGSVATRRLAYQRLRAVPIADDVQPAGRFDPRLPGLSPRRSMTPPTDLRLPTAFRPPDPGDLLFAPIPVLASLVRDRAISCVELARLALERLTAVDPALHCVVTLTEARALAAAEALDHDLAAGRWRGPLHGIPWGAKDLLAVRGQPTTWGTRPYADQRLDFDATVVGRLDAAGAVLVAKLSLGELAWGDVWFGGKTRNPWDPEQGASGSSAGSAAAVAAGAVAFSIGSETLGSIVSPSGRCGTSGLRPTFGRISRHGAMALAPSMDKLGPIARSADDCALVFGAVAGPDGRDETVVDVPFAYPGAASLAGRRVGVVETAFEREPAGRGVADELRALGAEVVPVALPEAPYDELWLLHEAEPAAMFDELTRSGRLAEMTRQEEKSWPVVFRSARLIPAVEFVRAGRIRRLLMVEMDHLMRDLDLLVHPTEDDACMTLENLTGHPAVAMPWGADAGGRPGSVTFAGHLDGEMDLLALARAWQEATGHHLRRPPL